MYKAYKSCQYFGKLEDFAFPFLNTLYRFSPGGINEVFEI